MFTAFPKIRGIRYKYYGITRSAGFLGNSERRHETKISRTGRWTNRNPDSEVLLHFSNVTVTSLLLRCYNVTRQKLQNSYAADTP